MKTFFKELTFSTRGKGTYEITDAIEKVVVESSIQQGIVTVFLQHTSASLIIFENADHTARLDLENFFDRLVPEKMSDYVHTMEGADDMPSHLRMVLTRTSETIPVHEGRLTLGTWQGIFLFEHRRQSHHRKISVSVMGA
ncbi:MAG: secondary thiamine-phosphate synthase enzyme YjbQ [Verrucomicrobiae bacterium]|nr:secondary thiamine-phosphate synthase enzyme YjbQ [Verrucomicrobiae bacterium]